MTETAISGPRLLCAVAGSAALVAAGLTPVTTGPQISTRAVAAVPTVSTEVALTSDAVIDGLDALADTAAFDVPGAAQAFDLSGLLNAEFDAAQGLFNSIFSLPATLFNDAQALFNSLVDLNFGMAFSALFAIPQDIVNYVIGLPGMVVNTVYEMAVVIPGEFVFNFG